MSKSIKVAILGAPQVGKSTYIGRWCTGEFKRVEEKNVKVYTTIGPVKMTLSTKPEFVDEADVVLIMYDKTEESRKVAQSIETEMTERKKSYVVVQNKIDKGLSYKQSYPIVISLKSHFNFEKPILHLLRAHFKDQGLQFDLSE